MRSDQIQLVEYIAAGGFKGTLKDLLRDVYKRGLLNGQDHEFEETMYEDIDVESVGFKE